MVKLSLDRFQLDDFAELAKPRIVVMVMLTAAAGFWLAGPEAHQAMLLFHVLVGTALVASGTSALNQVSERDADALMHRTRGRPLPAGRLSVAAASAFAWTTGVAGVVYLGAFANILTAGIAAATLMLYAFVYTPLKKRTSIATLVGAVPGALPIVGGWTAVRGTLGGEVWVLFWILFLWQLPHFLALAWMYRDDYARAGFKMLSVGDPDGRKTFGYATLYAAALVPVSLAPTIVGIAGTAYFVGAMVLSGAFLYASFSAVRHCTMARARRVFTYSLAYLPLLLILMGSRI
ncbi:MAG: protoheme IX farnesyltransferase [Gemmatimonadetes bacterium]|nr:protoheme IX farnesyltransferase [Gemmatimonadota bacterium]